MIEEFLKVDILLICGNYNSGKSFLANKYFKTFKRINRNEIRKSLKEMTSHGEKWTPGDFSKELDELVKHTEMSLLNYFIKRNEKVLIDNSSITKRERFRYIKEAQLERKTIGCIFIDVPLQVLIDRNNRKESIDQIPEEVLKNIDMNKELPDKDECFQVFTTIQQT